MDQDNTILEYKNFWLFYKNLYLRLFNVINILIDENEYNINKIKNNTIDFLDSYSYYLTKKKEISKDDKDKSGLDILQEFKDFESFYEDIKDYPSVEYEKARKELKKNNYDLSKLGEANYDVIVQEYYIFFEKTLKILKRFVLISSDCGFLPNVKSKASAKNIGFANFDTFFNLLEELKIKFSDITNNISIKNSLRTRRAGYCMLIVFNAYFKNKDLVNYLEDKLSFSFISNKEDRVELRKIASYKSLYDMSTTYRLKIEKKYINDLKINISYMKRFISYEFGELDMSPRVKKKWGYDPTGT